MKKIIYILLLIASVQLHGMEEPRSSRDSIEKLVIDNGSGETKSFASHNSSEHSLTEITTTQNKPKSTTKLYSSSNSAPEEFMYEQRIPTQSFEPHNSGGLSNYIYDQATGGTPTHRNSLGKAFRWMGKIIGNAAVAQELIGLGKKEEGTATKQIYKKVDALLEADLSIDKKIIDSYVLRLYWATSAALELHNELVELRINDEKRPESLAPLIEKANKLLIYSTSDEDHALKSSILPSKVVSSLNREISHASKRMQRKE